jgi:hypothetical protein
MNKTIPDFGTISVFHEGVELTCRAAVPGKSFHDLAMEFYRAKSEAKPGDELAGDPSKWPDNRGLRAFLDMVLEAIYQGGL